MLISARRVAEMGSGLAREKVGGEATGIKALGVEFKREGRRGKPGSKDGGKKKSIRGALSTR